MHIITDSERGVTVVEEPYIEEERDASKLNDFCAYGPPVYVRFPVVVINAPLPNASEVRPLPPVLPVILGHPATTLVGNAHYY